MEPKLLTANRFVDQNTGICYRYVFSDTEYFRPHYHDYYELFVFIDGSAYHYANGTKTKLYKGDLIFIRPNDVHDFYLCDNHPFSLLNITFTTETADEIFNFLSSGFPKEQLLSSPMPPSISLTQPQLERINDKMSKIRAIDPNNTNSIKTHLRIFICDIFTRYFLNLKSDLNETPLWLENLCEKISENDNFKQGTELFFSLTDKTREHVSRSVKKYYNMTVTEYINSLRVNYIANMLINSNHKICNIIYDSGFNNISWASTVFKDKYGVTMQQYRTANSVEILD